MLTGTSNSGRFGGNGMGGGSGVAADKRLQRALLDLREAIQSKDAESVCSAYQFLRDVGGALGLEKLMRIADKAVGGRAKARIVKAYASRGCFMCDTGTSPCRHCGGSGYVERGRSCPHCGGVAMVPCGFCGGTGWAGRDTIPKEFMAAVLKYQLDESHRDLIRFDKVISRLAPETIRNLPVAQRGELISWLIRLQSRLLDLAKLKAVDPERQADMSSRANKIGVCLDLLRRHSRHEDEV
ncbi:MAG: hypothetical protein J7M14_01685 [Planctomycetes bacterium]|nr:hypothetical protein [Planctomycetota bacterium]